MKKYLFTLVAVLTMMCMAQEAKAQTVYISTGSNATAYHKSKTCSYLQNSKELKSVSTAEAKNLGRHACARCYPELAGAKTTATTKKTVAKKTTTTTATKTTPARDEKGRFVKTTDAKKTTTDAKKTTTATKKTTTTAKKTTTTAKKTAEKAAKETKKTTTTATKTTPARDEKGRFIKKADTETKKTTTKKTTKKAA